MAQSVEPQITNFVHRKQEQTVNKELENIKKNLLSELERRVTDKILERSNADLLSKLIRNAESANEAIAIVQLGTTYKRTGLHYDKRLEKQTNEIKYFKKNEELSFSDGVDTIPHKLIIGDNYDALRNLLIQYRGKVDVIYIDPPYGKDSMGEFAKTNYENAISRDNLLSMLYSRLVLAKELLSNEGFIFCSIDDKNYAYIKCLFDDVFGEGLYINSFVWKKNSSGKTEKDKFTINTEYVILYSKSKNYILNDIYKPLSQASIDLYKYDDNDGRGKYASVSLQKPANPGPDTSYDYIDNTGKKWQCPPKGWRMTYDKVKALENDNRLIFSGERPRVKDYWNERKNEGKRVDTLWSDLPENSKGSSQLADIVGKDKFDNPKPIELIQRCIGISDNNAIVLDFFAGSGTTGQTVLTMNRKDEGNRLFILCQSNEVTDKNPHGIALDVTAPRLKRIMTGSCYTSSDKYPFYSGSNNFPWLKGNEIYGGSLDVYELETVSDSEHIAGKTAFDVIDETLYGKTKFEKLEDKIQWVCEHFDITEKSIESDKDWVKRVESK